MCIRDSYWCLYDYNSTALEMSYKNIYIPFSYEYLLRSLSHQPWHVINSTLLIVHGTWADLEIPQNYQKNLKIMCCFLYKNKVTILVWCDVTLLICDVAKCSLVKLVVRLITNCMFVLLTNKHVHILREEVSKRKREIILTQKFWCEI